jgi:hypothetical protein
MADPFWLKFCTPLAQRILSMITDPAAAATADQPYILEETIDDVLADGRYVIGGDTLTTKGTAKLRKGQRVHVFWRRGRRERILTHQWQRAQGGRPPTVGGIVEELILTADQRLFFRNDSQVTDLQLATLIGGTAVTFSLVRWGQRDNTFFLQTTESPPRYVVFALNRPAGSGFEQPAAATRVKIVTLPTVTLPFALRDVRAVDQFLLAPGYAWDLYHTWTLTDRPRIFPTDAVIVDAVLTETPTGELDMAILAQVPTVVEEPFPWDNAFAQQRYYDALVVIQAGTGAVLWTAPVTAEVRLAGDDLRLDAARLIRWDLRSPAGQRVFVSQWLRQSRFMTGTYFTGSFVVVWPNLDQDGGPYEPGDIALSRAWYGDQPLPAGPFSTFPQTVTFTAAAGNVYTVTSTAPTRSFRLDGPVVGGVLVDWSETDQAGVLGRTFTARSIAWLKFAPAAATLFVTQLVAEAASRTRAVIAQPSAAGLIARLFGLAFMAPDLAYAITEAQAESSRPDEREHFIAWPPAADAGPSFLSPVTAGAERWARGTIAPDQEQLKARPPAGPATLSIDYHVVEAPGL